MPDLDIRREGAVIELQLHRPQVRNALSRSLIAQLDAALQSTDADDTAHCVLLCAQGDHFCAGADLKEVLAMRTSEAAAQGYTGSSRALHVFGKPVVCAVEGYALGGGCELAEMCDIVIASDTAVFGHPEVSVGTIPGAGGVQRSMRILGRALAMDVHLAGRRLSAHEALQAGVVSRVCAAGQALATARELAQRIAAMPPRAARQLKRAARLVDEQPLSAALEAEAVLFRETLDWDKPARR